MKEYIYECKGCGDIRKMMAANTTVTINHPNCGTYKYASEVTNNSKTQGTRASKPPNHYLSNRIWFCQKAKKVKNTSIRK